jgi:tRNA modification GTPase
LAQPGELTERAYLNGRIDLAQAEAVADLIDASTEAAARSASRSLSGAFSQATAGLRENLVRLRMLVEATLDFPEEDIDFIEQANARGQLAALQQQREALLRQARQGALLQEGIRVVIAGQPNAGKSSLLNALAGAELAIVTPIAGTTRDKVSQTIQIEGVPLHIIDTAGLRESEDTVERIGIQRAWDEVAQADVVLFLRDLTRAQEPSSQAAEADIAKRIARLVAQQSAARGAQGAAQVLTVWNKLDAAPLGATLPTAVTGTGAQPALHAPQPTGQSETQPAAALQLSALTGEGLSELRQTLLHLAGWQPAASEGLFSARARHLQALQRMGDHLGQAQAVLQAPQPALDLLAEELRLAQNALNQITGEFGVEELLGEIFSRFCIGK